MDLRGSQGLFDPLPKVAALNKSLFFFTINMPALINLLKTGSQTGLAGYLMHKSVDISQTIQVYILNT